MKLQRSMQVVPLSSVSFDTISDKNAIKHQGLPIHSNLRAGWTYAPRLSTCPTTTEYDRKIVYDTAGNGSYHCFRRTGINCGGGWGYSSWIDLGVC